MAPAVELDESLFMRKLIRHLSGTLQDVVGLEDAEGFVSVVGQKMGDEIGRAYRDALGVNRLPAEQLGTVMVDLKRRINGDFRVIEENDEKIVLGNTRCPFGRMVEGRPALCMMTSNVFGTIAARSTGYAKIHLEQTIAGGHPGCRVVVHLRPGDRAEQHRGREYFSADCDAHV